MSPNRRRNPYRHPLGRTCRDPRNLLLILLLMPKALVLYRRDCKQGRP